MTGLQEVSRCCGVVRLPLPPRGSAYHQGRVAALYCPGPISVWCGSPDPPAIWECEIQRSLGSTVRHKPLISLENVLFCTFYYHCPFIHCPQLCLQHRSLAVEAPAGSPLGRYSVLEFRQHGVRHAKSVPPLLDYNYCRHVSRAVGLREQQNSPISLFKKGTEMRCTRHTISVDRGTIG